MNTRNNHDLENISSVNKSTSENITAIITNLSIHSLRVELQRRKLSTNGLRSVLERRLIDVLNDSYSLSLNSPKKRPRLSNQTQKPVCISVPQKFHTKQLSNGNDKISSLLIHNNFVLDPPSVPPKLPFNAILRHRSVWIIGDATISSAWGIAGPLGKANLSRSAPAYSEAAICPVALRGRAMRQRLSIENSQTVSTADRADVEHLQLSLVEAYHAAFAQRVIRIQDNSGKWLSDPIQVWRLFCEKDSSFAALFVAFCRYRAAGWYPRSGLKYGVDWVLYPSSVTKKHAHAPYCIRTRIASNDEDDVSLDRTWIALQSRLRLVKNVAKTLIVANIFAEGGWKDWKTPKEAFKAIRINEITVDRWIP